VDVADSPDEQVEWDPPGSLTLQITIANVVGGLLVLFYLALSLPAAEGRDPGLWGDLPMFALYAGVIAVAGWRLSRRVDAEAAWITEGRRPTDEERAWLLGLPWRLAVFFVRWWTVMAVVSAVANRITEHAVASNVKVLVAVILGGFTTASIVFLLVERSLRPLVAYVLDGRPPARTRALGTDARMIVAWILGAGIPLVFIALIPVAWNDDRASVSWPVSVLFMAVAGLLAGVVVMVGVARSITEPLASVRDAMARVQAGDLDVDVPVDDTGEVGQLQGGFNEMVAGLRERQRLHDLFGRHVGPDVASRALETGVQLGGEVRDVSVLFVDLIGSTAIAEQRSAGEVVDLLNRFFDAVVRCTTDEGGWVNKFEGDGALCVFGAPVAQADHPTRALRAARGLRSALVALGIDAGIGVASGEAVAGNVGAEHRFEYTVIGRPVNEAARLTDAAKREPGRVLASSATVGAAPAEAPHWRDNGTLELRGVGAPVAVATPSV
jgi:adenylate cyclase